MMGEISNNADENTKLEHWLLFVISNNNLFDTQFIIDDETALPGIQLKIIKENSLDERVEKSIFENYQTIVYLAVDQLNDKNVVNELTRLKRNHNTIPPYIVVWASYNNNQARDTILSLKLINELRIDFNHSKKCLIQIIYTNIQNQRQIIELEQLKTNLECKIQERTITLTQANKKLQEAIIQNTNTHTKLHQQRIQIEQQNEDIINRNNELELAFKKSTKQHIQLQKVLYQNEKQRENLEEALAEIQLKNDTLHTQYEEIIAQRDFIEQQNEEIQAQRDVAITQRDKITEQRQEITDNILYASRIQQALFPPADLMNQFLPTHFILNQPKDVVSGDFYWVAQNKTKTVIAVADCTGHGISGAMMSMLGTAFLNEIVNKDDVTNSSAILEQLRERVISSLHQTTSDNFEYSRDGMDISVVIIDIVDNILEYSGANNPIYIFRQGELMELKPDRMPLGIHEFYEEPFSVQTINLNTKDIVVMFSDGYADQFGGEFGKKLKYSAFKTILTDCCKIPNKKRVEMLSNSFEKWRNHYDQIDDVLVLGFEIN